MSSGPPWGEAPALPALRCATLRLGHWSLVSERVPGHDGTGAARYLEARSWSTERSGQFYATAPGKMIGELTLMTHAHLLDEESQEALWKATVGLTAEDLPLRLVKAS